MISGIIFILILVGGAVLIVWYLKSFYAERANREKRQKNIASNMAENIFWNGAETWQAAPRIRSLGN